jgi:hypothetical protein
MKLLNRNLINLGVRRSNLQFLRKESTQTGTSTYEGDGKTSVQVLNKETEYGLMINSISQSGFRLNNDIFVLGPMAIFPR